MFDRTVLVAPTRRVVEHQHVTINRAPTDKSVALLKDMEKAARDKVISSISVGGNRFECVLQSEVSAIDDLTRHRVVLDLNGTRMVVEHEEPRWKARRPEDVMADIRDAVALKIANAVLSRAFNSVVPLAN